MTKHSQLKPLRTAIEESIQLDVPERTAFECWKQFEAYPEFLTDVEAVERIDDGRRLRCRYRLGGKHAAFEAEICEEIPGKRIAWRTTAGTRHAGVVTFHRLDDSRSKVMLQFDFEPSGFVERVGDLLGVTGRWTRQALASFKAHAESDSRAPTSAPNERSLALADRECAPCEGDAEPLQGARLAELIAELDNGWEVVGEHHIQKDYAFDDFAGALAFVDRVGALAEELGHHPDIQLSWGRVRLEVQTHAISGLTDSDFVLAAKADEVLGAQ